MTKEQQDTWLAAIFDGEGHFDVQAKGSHPHIGIKIVQVYSDELLEKIKEVTGYGKVDPGLQWRTHSTNEVKNFIDRVRPYLIVKQYECKLLEAITATFVQQGYHPTPQALVYRDRLMQLWEDRPTSRKSKKVKNVK